MNRLWVVAGCGGIGYWLVPRLALVVDATDTVMMYDDDVVEEGNRERQWGVFGGLINQSGGPRYNVRLMERAYRSMGGGGRVMGHVERCEGMEGPWGVMSELEPREVVAVVVTDNHLSRARLVDEMGEAAEMMGRGGPDMWAVLGGNRRDDGWACCMGWLGGEATSHIRGWRPDIWDEAEAEARGEAGEEMGASGRCSVEQRQIAASNGMTAWCVGELMQEIALGSMGGSVDLGWVKGAKGVEVTRVEVKPIMVEG